MAFLPTLHFHWRSAMCVETIFSAQQNPGHNKFLSAFSSTWTHIFVRIYAHVHWCIGAASGGVSPVPIHLAVFAILPSPWIHFSGSNLFFGGFQIHINPEYWIHINSYPISSSNFIQFSFPNPATWFPFGPPLAPKFLSPALEARHPLRCLSSRWRNRPQGQRKASNVGKQIVKRNDSHLAQSGWLWLYVVWLRIPN